MSEAEGMRVKMKAVGIREGRAGREVCAGPCGKREAFVFYFDDHGEPLNTPVHTHIHIFVLRISLSLPALPSFRSHLLGKPLQRGLSQTPQIRRFLSLISVTAPQTPPLYTQIVA